MMDQMEIHTIIGDLDTICPISEVKNYLRIENTTDDTLLEDIRQYASDCAENYAGIDFIAKRRKLFLSSLPYDGVVILPFANENIGSLDMTIHSVKDMDNNTIDDYEFLGQYLLALQSYFYLQSIFQFHKNNFLSNLNYKK